MGGFKLHINFFNFYQTIFIKFLKVDLQKLMHVTRISTQGAKHNSYRRSWVLTYTLEYSVDLKMWSTYHTYGNDGSSSSVRILYIFLFIFCYSIQLTLKNFENYAIFQIYLFFFKAHLIKTFFY